MRTITFIVTSVICFGASLLHSADQPQKNPTIDFHGFLKKAQEVEPYRAQRRVSEASFLELSKFPDTIILDTRSAAKFKEIHVEGAVHLNFSEITDESLARLIPSKDTRILIYCNNNFKGEPVNFASKSAVAALNIPTFITLYSYGYENLFELAPLLDVDSTSIPLVRKSS